MALGLIAGPQEIDSSVQSLVKNKGIDYRFY